jgi:hypothetical protein
MLTFEQWQAEFRDQLKLAGYNRELTDEQLEELFELKLASPSQAYDIDCDIANGFTYEEACKENLG